MRRLQKYLVAFGLALSERMAYRLPLFLLFVQDLTIFGSLAFFFFAFPKDAISLPALFTTIMLGALLAPLLIHPIVMHNVADEIADGDLASYLLRPIRYLTYWATRSFAVRLFNSTSSIAVVAILWLTLPSFPILPPASPASATAFAGLLVGGLVLCILMDVSAGFAAFWLHRSFGPCWLVYVALQFLSGVYTPFVLFPDSIQSILTKTPFAYIAHAPIQAYLGNITGTDILETFVAQWTWIVIIGVFVAFAWQRGVCSYEAYGR